MNGEPSVMWRVLGKLLYYHCEMIQVFSAHMPYLLPIFNGGDAGNLHLAVAVSESRSKIHMSFIP